jgi:hypothetical protein
MIHSRLGHRCSIDVLPVSTPEQKCIGSPEQNYIDDAVKEKALAEDRG